jgi:alanine racemase
MRPRGGRFEVNMRLNQSIKYREVPLSAFGSRPILRIRDIDAVLSNYRLFRERAHSTGTRCAPVLKADVHGLGMADVAPALYAEGAREYFVEEAIEGAILRQHLSHRESTIYVMAGYLKGEEGLFASNSLIPCVNSISQLVRLRDSTKGQAPVKVAIYFDCDMNRIGFSRDETEELARDFRLLTGHLEVVMYMSHLYNIKGHDHRNCYRQREILIEYLKLLPRRDVSLACTDSVTLLPNKDFNFDLIRPGIGLVGGAPNARDVIPGIKSAVEYYVKLSRSRIVGKGSTVGYGGAYTVNSDTKIAIAHLGYKDGYVRALSRLDSSPDRGAWMAIGGIRANVIGKISLGLTALDVTNVPDEVIEKLGYAEVLGPNVDMKQIADIGGCYEFLAALGRPNPKIQDFTLDTYKKHFNHDVN